MNSLGCGTIEQHRTKLTQDRYDKFHFVSRSLYCEKDREGEVERERKEEKEREGERERGRERERESHSLSNFCSL